MKKQMSIALTLVMLVAFSACSSGSPSTPTGNDLRQINVILDYLVNTNHTGLFVAKELGYFADEGLDVNIIEPADGVTPSLIAAGRGHFGVSYQEDLTFARASADPLPIKAVATIIQHNTSGFASHASKGITSVKDFEGKTYAGWGSPAEEAILNVAMRAQGADFSKLTFITSDASGYFGLEDRFDLIWIFEAWDAVAAELDGVPLNYIELRTVDERLDFYTPILIAHEDTLKNDPDLVRSFLRAASKGYNYAIEHPQEAAEILYRYAPAYSLEMLTRSQNFLALKYAEDAPYWGHMKTEVWENYTGFMLDTGLIDRNVLASECFTNEYLS